MVVKFIQVLWLGMEECNKTWEKASDIPPAVIMEFEHGSKAVITDNIEDRMGQTMHTLVTAQGHTQPLKNTIRPVIQNNTGYVRTLITTGS